MTLNISNIDQEEFLTFTAGIKPNYVKVEEALIKIGGAGIPGMQFKQETLEKAGWKYGKLISYGAHPDIATGAFNKILKILHETQDKEEIENKLH